MTLQRLVTLRKHVYPGIHTSTTSPCLVTRQKSQRFIDAQKRCAPGHSDRHNKSVGVEVTLQHLVTLRKGVHPGIHTTTSSLCSVTRQKKLGFGDAHKSCAPSLRLKSQHSGTLQRSVTLITEEHPPVHAAPTRPCVLARQPLTTLRSAVRP